MKNSLFFLFFLSVITILNAQQETELQGIVVEQNSKFNTGVVVYLDKTTINVPGAKISVVSDEKGGFKLILKDKFIGDITCINASKSNYQLVNDEELKEVIILESKMPLKVILSKKGKLYENQLNYIKIAEEIAQNIYDKRIEILTKEGRKREFLMTKMSKEFIQPITEVEQAQKLLLEQLNTAKRQAKRITNKFITTNLDDETAAYQSAFRAFLAKDVDSALMVLDSVDMFRDLEIYAAQKETKNLQRSTTEIVEQKRGYINQCIFKAKLHTLKYEFEQAEKIYELALKYDTTNVDLVFDFYVLLKRRNKNEKAITYYEKAISIYREKSKTDPAIYTPYVAEMLNSLGSFRSNNNDRAGAEKYYNEALSIYKVLSKESPKKYLPLLGLTFNYLADVKRDNEDIYSAHKDYDDALLIYRNLAETNPNEYLPKAANVLNNLGNIRNDNNDPILAKVYYKESLSIYRKLSKKNPSLYLSDIGIVLNNLANIKSDNLSKKGAKKYYQEAIDIYRDLVKVEPLEYLPYLATTLNNLSLVKSEKKDYEGALRDCEESLVIRRKLAQDNPSTYLPEVAATLNNLGMIKNDKKDMVGGQKNYEEAISIYQDTSVVNPLLYLSETARTLNNLGVLKNNIGDKIGSKEEYEKALTIYKELADKNARIYNLDVCMTYINIALYNKDALISGDDSAKAEGLKIVKDAKKRIDIYQNENMTIVNYKYSIKQLMIFFEEY